MFPWASLIDGRDWWMFVAFVVLLAETVKALVIGSRPHRFGESERAWLGIGIPAIEFAVAEDHIHQSRRR